MPEIQLNVPETKARTGEVAEAFDQFTHAFDSFREANDQRLSEIERRMSADVVTVEKVERIGQAMDEQEKRIDDLFGQVEQLLSKT